MMIIISTVLIIIVIFKSQLLCFSEGHSERAPTPDPSSRGVLGCLWALDHRSYEVCKIVNLFIGDMLPYLEHPKLRSRLEKG